MADIENWAVATDRKMHENAITALKAHKKTLRKEKMYKVGKNTHIVLPDDMDASEVKKRIKMYEKHLSER